MKLCMGIHIFGLSSSSPSNDSVASTNASVTACSHPLLCPAWNESFQKLIFK